MFKISLYLIMIAILMIFMSMNIMAIETETSYDPGPMPIPFEGNPIMDLIIVLLGGSAGGITLIGLIHQLVEAIHDKWIFKKISNFWIVSVIGMILVPVLAFAGGFDCRTILDALPGKFAYLNIQCGTGLFYVACAILGFLAGMGAIVFDQPIQAKRMRENLPDKWKGGIFVWLLRTFAKFKR